MVCKKPAVDAHHLLERRLWPDGGYHLDNGVSLCAEHHLDQYPTGLHKIGEANFWAIAKAAYGIDPATWIAQFSKEGAAEIARINAAKELA